MKSDFQEKCLRELEVYTHVIADGDITPLVYMLLKDNKDPEALIKYLGGKLREKEEQRVNFKNIPSFEKLFETGDVIGS